MEANLKHRLFREAPVVFPMLGIFHVIMFLFQLWLTSSEPFPDIIWLQPLWSLLFMLAFIGVWLMKKVAAYAYLILTTINVLIYFFTDIFSRDLYISAMWFLAILFCFPVLVYFKRFR